MKTQLFRIVTQHNHSILTIFSPFSGPQKGVVRKVVLSETFILVRDKFPFFQNISFLTLFVWYLLFCGILTPCKKLFDAIKEFWLSHKWVKALTLDISTCIRSKTVWPLGQNTLRSVICTDVQNFLAWIRK